MTRLRLLLISAVLPFPGTAGQQQRVRNKLLALRERFEITFLTFAPAAQVAEVERQLRELCDHALVMESSYLRASGRRLLLRVAAGLYAAACGLKTSNFLVGKVELSPARVLAAIEGRSFDLALFEYWHAHACVPALRRLGIPSVLDMHDLLWRSFERQLAGGHQPEWLRRWRVGAYRRREEASWQQFDALISINRNEDAHVRQRLPGKKVFYAPMGVDLRHFPCHPQPAQPPRLAYYGGMASPHNQRDALFCARKVMPRIWKQRPDAELWLVGSHPPEELRQLAAAEPRIHVTGFVPEVPPLLSTMTAVLCPWTGTYGFRSRLVEVMALGVPVVASQDAVSGMDLRSGEGLLLADGAKAMAAAALELLAAPQKALQLGRRGRLRMEELYSFEATYGRMTEEIAAWLITWLDVGATP